MSPSFRRPPTPRPHRALPDLVVVVTLLLSAVPSHAAKPPVLLDERWVAPDFASRGIEKIAVLPAVTHEAIPTQHPVSTEFFNQFRTDGHRWLPPSSVYSALGRNARQRDSALRVIGAAVRRQGRADAATAAALTRLLRVDALVFLRVDRWEHANSSTEVTSIEVRAEMVDARGEPLWRSVGRSRVFGETRRSELRMPEASPDPELLQTLAQSGGGSSSGSSGGSSSSSSGSSGSAGGSAGGSSGAAPAPPPPPARTYNVKVERHITSAEDLVMMSGGGPDASPPAFLQATEALVRAWLPLLPRPAGAADPARPPTRP